MTKINKKRVRLLVEALRSGRFAQGRGALGRTSGGVSYCCLGVACEVAIEGGLEVRRGTHLKLVLYNNASGTLPLNVQKWYGFPCINPCLRWAEEHFLATELNDSLNLSFSQIADAFEQTYLADDDD